MGPGTGGSGFMVRRFGLVGFDGQATSSYWHNHYLLHIGLDFYFYINKTFTQFDAVQIYFKNALNQEDFKRAV